MNYTFQKRRELNDAFLHESSQLNYELCNAGVPYLSIGCLPSGSEPVESIKDISELLPYTERAWSKVVPVFVQVRKMKLDGSTFETYYLVNYVNCSAPSMAQAAEYITSGRLYWIPGTILIPHGKRNS